MRAFKALLSMEFRSTFGWKPLTEYHNYKDWLKLAGAILVGLFVAADIGFLFVSSAISQYQALKPQGLEGLLLLNGAITASVAVFFLGFIMILSGFSLSPAEAQLFALPLTDRSQLASRFALVYLSQAAFGLFMFGINLTVFGIAEASPLGFWLVGILAAFALPLPPLALAWCLAVPLMSTARFMRSKNAVLVASGIIGVAFALAFNLYVQQSLQKLGDQAWLLANYAGPGTVLNLAGSAWPPSQLAWKALEAANGGAWAEGLMLAAALLAGGLVLSALAVVLLAGGWRRAVLAFGEARLHRLGKADAIAYIDGHFRRHGAFRALVLREWRLMNREPRFFVNGPFIIVLLPFILAVTYVAQRSALGELVSMLGGAQGERYGFLAAAGFGAFLGSSTSVASTGLSRDAKALPAILGLPIGAFEYMLAKLVHAFIWATAGALVGSVAIGIFARLAPLVTVGAAAVALGLSALVNLAGLWLDTAHPRLGWDNPMAALKQNPNSVYVILGSMALIVLLCWSVISFALEPRIFALLFISASILIFAVGIAAYARFAIMKIRDIEAR